MNKHKLDKMAEQTTNNFNNTTPNTVLKVDPNAPIVNLGSERWEISKKDLIDNQNNRYTHPHFINEGTIGSYKIYICNLSGEKDIFTDSNNAYKIEVTLTVTDFYTNISSTPTAYLGLVSVEFKIGYLPSVIKKIPVSDYDKFLKFTFFYQPTEFDLKKPDAKFMYIRKLSPGTVKIVDSKVEYGVFSYDTTLNNTLYENIPTNYFTIPAQSNGFNIQTFLGSKDGGVTSIKYGNGTFKSGVWKTGVWLDGWRGLWDGNNDIFYFESINLNTYQLNQNLWILKIDSNSNIDNYVNIVNNIVENDFIALSNVVGIDMNEERYLLKDYYRVATIDAVGSVVTLTIEIPVAKFPLMRFEIDSPNHLIYVTKNIWLGGTFLNGYFRGIWNYGLFKGFPFTTVMEDSHFVSGIFDGGRFISRIGGITSSTSEFKEYHTGLVQYFEFFDNNISETEGFNNYIDNTYQSWIDVNYYTQSFVNLNSLTSIYDDNFGKKVPISNLYGYPTMDVISSYSKFKNTTDRDLEYYNLGTKYKIFTDHLGDNGYFRKAFNSEAKPGLDEFIGAGWTANTGNFYGTPTVSFVYNSNITRRNVNRISIILATFGYNVLNNNNIKVDDKKYTVVEYDLEYFQRGTDPNTGEFTNSFSKPLNLLGSNYPSTTNIYDSGIVKTEYFYNKNALDLILRYNSEYVPPNELLAMYGFNYTYSNSTGETNPSYSTTYSFVMPRLSDQYDAVVTWEVGSGVEYDKGDIVRRGTSDALGRYYISLKDNNTDNDLRDTEWWAQTTVGYNGIFKEVGLLEQDAIFDFFTSARINYFKFLEIDALPFFNYYNFEINFFSTIKKDSYLALEFTKPHGLKRGDIIEIKLDETKYNPDYEGQFRVESVFDGPKRNGDVEYVVKTDKLYGNTVSYLSESGTVKKVGGDRIDKRIQTNYYVAAPKVDGLDENFVYLGNNQIFVDRNVF